MLKPAPGRFDGSSTGLPAIVNGMPKFVPLTGMPVEAETDDDAGHRRDPIPDTTCEVSR